MVIRSNFDFNEKYLLNLQKTTVNLLSVKFQIKSLIPNFGRNFRKKLEVEEKII